MSVSATDFHEGAELFDQEKYRSQVSTSIEPNSQMIEADFKRPLTERISGPINIPGKYADYRLDDVIVRVPSDAFRRHQAEQWNRAKKQEEEKQWVWTATAIITALAAIAGGLARGGALGTEAANSPLSPVVVVVGSVAAFVSLIFTASANAAAAKAAQQINKWNGSPLMTIGKERNDAFDQGFLYIYSRDLKLGRDFSYTGRFHPKLVEHEYKKYFEAFCKKLLGESCSSCKVAWIDSFLESNPLSLSLMTYGLGEIPERMRQVIDDYARLASFLKEIKQSYRDLKSRERETAQERIKGHNSERALKLKPFTDRHDAEVATAKDNRDRIFQQYPLETQMQHRDAQKNYEAIKKVLDENYSLRADPINKIYDGKVQEVEKDRESHIQKLENQKYHQLVNNYNAARDLLIRAQQAWKGQQYQPVNLTQYFPLQVPQAQPVYYYPPQMSPGYQQPLPLMSGYPVNPAYQPQPQQVVVY